MSLDTDFSDVLLRESASANVHFVDGCSAESCADEFAGIMNGRGDNYKGRALLYYDSLSEQFQEFIRENRRYSYLLRAAKSKF